MESRNLSKMDSYQNRKPADAQADYVHGNQHPPQDRQVHQSVTDEGESSDRTPWGTDPFQGGGGWKKTALLRGEKEKAQYIPSARANPLESRPIKELFVIRKVSSGGKRLLGKRDTVATAGWGLFTIGQIFLRQVTSEGPLEVF